MRAHIASAVLVVLLMLPLAASAQDAAIAGENQLQMEMKRKRAIVHPPPPRAAIEGDVDRAEAVVQERRDRIIREVTRPEPRRPDLDYSVTSGIQARNLQRLRR